MKDFQILVLYKNSSYEKFFLAQRPISPFVTIRSRDVLRFKQTHLEHFKTLKKVKRVLKLSGFHFKVTNRGDRFDLDQYNLIITVGGDGTFLQAARNITHQYIFGVNSDPRWSVGMFCSADSKSFPSFVQKLISKKFSVRTLQRLVLTMKSHPPTHFLNDVLICHKNPAAMSRYHFIIGGKKEEQKSSGLWLATAAGSSGAIHSAGGKILPVMSSKFQYIARELYAAKQQKYHFRSGILQPGKTVSIISLMQDGVIFVDGCRTHYPFPFGQEASITPSRYPLKVIRP